MSAYAPPHLKLDELKNLHHLTSNALLFQKNQMSAYAPPHLKLDELKNLHHLTSNALLFQNPDLYTYDAFHFYFHYFNPVQNNEK